MSWGEKKEDFSFDIIHKLILVGDSGVGKSNILFRYSDNCFGDSFISTIGVDFKFHNVTAADGTKIKLQIWDTAGQDRFRAITRSYYRGSHGVLLVYDVTSRESFERLPTWLTELQDNIMSNVPIYLVGNKCDLTELRQVRTEEGETFARERGLHFIETSAKSAHNIEKAFLSLVAAIRENKAGCDACNRRAEETTKQKGTRTLEPIPLRRKQPGDCCVIL